MSRLLNSIEAFYAMHLFIEHYFEITKSDSLGALLSCMHFLNDDQTADPALWEDWIKITDRREMTEVQAFYAMDAFLRQYYQRSTSSNVTKMLYDLSLVIEDKEGKEEVWYEWLESIDYILKNA